MSTEQSTEPATVPTPHRRVGVLIAVAVLALALDAVTKALVVANLEGKSPVTVLGGLLYVDVIRNSGAAFSMATSLTWVLSLVQLGVSVAIIWVSPRVRSVGWAIGLGLVLAGALGNLADRIFRSPGPLRGHVVDFISAFRPYGEGFAVFNLADSAITCGAILIVLMALLGKDFDGGIGKRQRLAEEHTSAEASSAAVSEEKIVSETSNTTSESESAS